jgi:hypothetical protein
MFRHVECGVRPPFRGGSEALWRWPPRTAPSRSCGTTRFPSVRRGSAIFVHVGTGEPTSGCVSLAAPRLAQLLRRLRPDARPLIVIGTSSEIRSPRFLCIT